MSELLFEGVAEPDLVRCRELWRAICATGSRGRRKVWSWEGLGTDVVEKREARAANLARVLGSGPRRDHAAPSGDTARVDLLPDPAPQQQPRSQPGWSGRSGTSRSTSGSTATGAARSSRSSTTRARSRSTAAISAREAVRVLLYEDLVRDPAAYVGRWRGFAASMASKRSAAPRVEWRTPPPRSWSNRAALARPAAGFGARQARRRAPDTGLGAQRRPACRHRSCRARAAGASRSGPAKAIAG